MCDLSQPAELTLRLSLVPSSILALLYAHSGQVASSYMYMASHKPTILVLKSGHPGVVGFVCMYVHTCMLCIGGRGWGLSMFLGWVPFFTLSIRYLLVCYTLVLSCTCNIYDAVM